MTDKKLRTLKDFWFNPTNPSSIPKWADDLRQEAIKIRKQLYEHMTKHEFNIKECFFCNNDKLTYPPLLLDWFFNITEDDLK